MGLLVKGTPLPWDKALEWLEYVRIHGIEQFLKIYHRVKDIEGDELKWGDELEYGIFQVDPKTKAMRLSLRGTEILKELTKKEEKFGRHDHALNYGCNFLPEYGEWMVEATPKVPYGGFVSDLCIVEKNMRLRRERLLAVLHEDEICPTVTCFPLLGVDVDTSAFSDPHGVRGGDVAQSDYVSDDVINSHPRFSTLTANIRKRRNRKIDIRVPIFQDIYTERQIQSEMKSINENACWSAEKSRPRVCSNEYPNGLEEEMPSSSSKRTSTSISDKTTYTDKRRRKVEPYPGFIHMDCMAFGMGMCCLQVTFQAKNIGESRHLYDHLAVLSPIFLALTAATPILKGRLADTDVRWATISASVDDRTQEESGESKPEAMSDEKKAKYSKMAGKGVRSLPKSRYEGISLYICNHKNGSDPATSLDMYNDVDIPYDEESYNTLVKRGVDESLAKHIAHLFVRDPLVIYSERINLDDDCDTDHFENLQSTNWQTVRWKPPPPAQAGDKHIGWRTEFRSMEIQLTDFENAAFTVFLVLVSRVILAFDLNLYIPLSKVDQNMEIAHRINSVQKEKFFFRSHLAPPEKGDCSKSQDECGVHDDPNLYEQMTIDEIMNGKGSYFPGLLPLVSAYLDAIGCDDETRETLNKYLDLIKKRSTGELPTAATWMRRYVQSHPRYQHDSIVSPEIAYDLLSECRKIGEGLTHYPDLLGDTRVAPIRSGKNLYEVPLISTAVHLSKRKKLLERYSHRTGRGCGC